MIAHGKQNRDAKFKSEDGCKNHDDSLLRYWFQRHFGSADNFDPRFLLNDARRDTARHRKRRNIARGHGIGREKRAASQ